jgi:phosphatidate cytidylyltransferase
MGKTRAEADRPLEDKAKPDAAPESAPKKKGPGNLAMRFLSAGVAVPLILLLLYKGPDWGMFLVVCAACCIGAMELFAMTHPGDRVSQVAGVALTLGAANVTFWGGRDVRVLMLALVAAPLVGPLWTLVRLGDMKTAAFRALAMSAGPLFVGVPLALLSVMRRDQGGDGPGYVVFCLMIAWFGDTGGYFGGRFLGKHKLYEAVSPKKTVEGAVGGLVGSAIGALCAHYIFLKSLPLVQGLVLSVVAGALGQAGDLGESLLKRSTGVKDSGQIVPGHGGILDRVDALMVVAACVYAYTLFK